ncbi:MAG: PIG-L family deacetylase [Planctomycetota bacterium]|nr:PIG-L family deacetylase [Planctomycetota bacterium]
MLRKLKKFAKTAARQLLPAKLHTSTRLWLLTEWPDREPQLIDQFTSDPVLILAPHQDDEVIGPGGAARRHVLAGATVTVVVLTDGRYGGYNPDGKLTERRKQESCAAAKIVGTAEPIFFDGPDTHLAETPDQVDRLARVLIDSKARFVYLPALTDFHVDHWATNRILHAALPRLPQEQANNLVIRGYEVWSPTLANRVVDISSVAELKRQAIEAFPSQTSIDDYTNAVLALNHYRALRPLHGHGHAEAFMELSVPEFNRLFAAANLRSEAATSTAR